MTPLGSGNPVQIHEGEELLNKLGVALCDYRIFSGGHPRFLESCERFLEALQRFYDLHPEQRHLLFVHRHGQVFFRKVPLSALTPPAIKLSRALEDKEVEGLRFGPDCNLTGLGVTIEGLAAPPTTTGAASWAEINARLEAEGLKASVGFFADHEVGSLEAANGLSTLAPAPGSWHTPLLHLPQLALPLEIYKSSLAALHELMSLLGAGSDPTFGPLLDVAQHLTEGMLHGEQSFLPLTAVRYEDEYTFNHSVNVCLLATAALKPFVRDPELLVRIGQAALLHDLGKSRVPSEVLYTIEMPAEDALAELERHPRLGAEVLLDSACVHPLTAIVAFDHHRRPVGTGYPRVRRQRDLDTVTSVIAAADLFEALTAERPYKRSLSPPEAFEALQRLPEARGLEPAIRLLFDTLTPYPPGTLVALDSGERAIVTRVHRGAPDRPSVRLLASRQSGWDLDGEETDLAALAAQGRPAPRIVRALSTDWQCSDSPLESEGDGEASTEQAKDDLERRLREGTLLITEG